MLNFIENFLFKIDLKVVSIMKKGRPRTDINYNKANEFCANRGELNIILVMVVQMVIIMN